MLLNQAIATRNQDMIELEKWEKERKKKNCNGDLVYLSSNSGTSLPLFGVDLCHSASCTLCKK